ncbi:MAG: hypothetical protein AAFR61_24185 [Bacteroidota bacterium]
MASGSLFSRWNFFIQKTLSLPVRERLEKVILWIAILSFVIHLGLIFLTQMGFLTIDAALLQHPIAATYTPFSFILIYEVYLVIYYLPHSFTTYIGKQYEIITLIIIRRLFKDLPSFSLSSPHPDLAASAPLLYDLLASLLLFFLIYLFYRESKKLRQESWEDVSQRYPRLQEFINFKKIVAGLLAPLLLGMAIYSFWDSLKTIYLSPELAESTFKNINHIFFDEFFTVLIVVDVFILLASFFYSDEFHKVIRNSGFIISTILIRLSFSVEDLYSILLMVGSVCFGILMLWIHNRFEQLQPDEPASR